MTRKSLTTAHGGGCACGHVRYLMHDAPMFVHCCHCTRCQRETGGPFAHHAMIEFTAFSVLEGEPEFVLVPTDSGGKHWVARCPHCRTALWNEHGSRRAITRYVRVGTLDAPSQFPPLAHIYVRSKQPWLTLEDGAPQFAGYYDAAKAWPQESLARYASAKTARVHERAKSGAARRKESTKSTG
ncbi:MAG: GFA family protein [Betaproteobacteria bacterium]|nr:MAG: GFA family protein [Betaproteobacteria bacterium]